MVSHIADILAVNTVPMGKDPFGRVKSGVLMMRGQFYLFPGNLGKFKNTVAKQVFTPEFLSKHTPFERHILVHFNQVTSDIYEYMQQHMPHEGKKFAAFEVIRWKRAPDCGVAGAQIMIIESTGNMNEWRRLSMISMRKMPIADSLDRASDVYIGLMEENEAWDNIVKAKWKRIIVRIV